MKTRNKTNSILLIILALFLTIACSQEEKNVPENASKGDMTATETNTQATNDETPTTTAETDLFEEDDSAEPEISKGPVTVRFAQGKTSKRYRSPIASGESHTYFLTASAGQTMSIGIDSSQDNAGFTVYNPAGYEISGGEETTEARDFSQELDDSGRYKIVVSSPRATDYDIDFAVAKAKALTPDEADGGANKTVRFGKGRSSASYSNSVIRGERDTYNLRAGAGQFMTVSITSVEDNASFQIVAPNGTDLVLDDTYWRGELPRDGNYKIIIGSGRGNATYTVNFKVEQSPIDH